MSAESVRLLEGDCREVLRGLPDASVDAIITDPPYELGFMGKGWDASGIAYDPAVWAECLRVLKPGGHLLSFGGTRTYHRMACAVEDAGFEIRDSIMWLYGSGFPKSKNLDGDWQGWGTALKPAHEPIVVARKPLVGTVAANVIAHGTGALNIDACRIEANDGRPLIVSKSEGSTGIFGDGLNGSSAGGVTTEGRWPANVALDEHAAAELDAQTGERPGMKRGVLKRGATTGRSIGGDSAYGTAEPQEVVTGYGDSGGASRFFYCAKAGKRERPKLDDGTAHPTVKPLALMTWLCRLVTPPGGIILDPFAGSGTTLQAARDAGYVAIGIEADPRHVELCRVRLAV